MHSFGYAQCPANVGSAIVSLLDGGLFDDAPDKSTCRAVQQTGYYPILILFVRFHFTDNAWDVCTTLEPPFLVCAFSSVFPVT